MSNQKKSQKLDQNQDQIKKRLRKRSTIEQIQQSLRKSKHKQDGQDQKNKITRYFGTNSVTKPAQPIKTVRQEAVDRSLQIQALEDQLRTKHKLIQQLKEKKATEEERINNIMFQMRQVKNKSKPFIANTLLQIAEARRQEKRRVNNGLGYFVQGNREFIEGEIMLSIRAEVDEKQAAIETIQQGCKLTKGKHQDHLRAISSLQFTQKELGELKKELQMREKELAVYKDRLRLVQKQKKSFYCRKGWPIIYDRYQTLELLGSGGFGQVYKCYDLDNNRIVAIKRIQFTDRGDPAEKEDFYRRLAREVDIQQGLKHPNIARFQRVIKIDENQNLLLFQLEYCGGPQLSTYLRKYGCLQEKEAKTIMKQLFSAIDYLSKLKQRIIHYDLKPGNIMFHEGVVKIVDFGLSKIMYGEDSRMELTSQGVGTYWYLPPETFQQYWPLINQKVDVWSLGVIFFELLYGKKPFGHGVKQEDIYNNGVILRAFQVQFPTENPRRLKVSEAAKNFIRDCLKYDQSQRLSPTQACSHEYLRK